MEAAELELLAKKRRILEELRQIEEGDRNFEENSHVETKPFQQENMATSCPFRHPTATPSDVCPRSAPICLIKTEPEDSLPDTSTTDSMSPIKVEKQEEEEDVVWKTVLESMENDHFDTLPEGWQRITHHSGLPVYFHRPTRVLTLSRPFMVGHSSARASLIPLSSIPCLHQKRITEKQEASAKQERTQEELGTYGKNILENLPTGAISVETFDEHRLSPDEITNYASSVFKFTKIKVKRFTSFRDKKLDRHERKTEETLREMGLTMNDIQENQSTTKTAPGMALINIKTQDTRFNKKNFVMNPRGKNSVTIIHEYVQRALKGSVRYDLVDTNCAAAPYSATAVVTLKKGSREHLTTSMKETLAILKMKGQAGGAIDGTDEDSLVIGSGQGISKKVAKLVAAECAVKVLFPCIRFDSNHTATMTDGSAPEQSYDSSAIELFESLQIEDFRVTDLCVKTGQPKPYQLLKEACNRSIKLAGIKPEVRTNTVSEQKSNVTVTVGDYSCTVTASGARVGKERASQGVFKQMHPDLVSFASILRLYANAQERRERKDQVRTHDEVIRMQNKGPHSEPNHLALRKLKAEMLQTTVSPLSRPSTFIFNHV